MQDDELKTHSHQYKIKGKTSVSPPYDTEGAGGGEFLKQTENTGGKETRPKNIYVNYIIKAKNVS